MNFDNESKSRGGGAFLGWGSRGWRSSAVVGTQKIAHSGSKALHGAALRHSAIMIIFLRVFKLQSGHEYA